MIYMDSLAQTPGERWSEPIRNLLAKEWEGRVLKKNIEPNTNEPEKKLFRRDTMVDIVPRVPSQTNHFDCGLFLLQYVECFLNVSIDSHFCFIILTCLPLSLFSESRR